VCALDDSSVGLVVCTDAAKMAMVPGVYAAEDIDAAIQNATFASANGVFVGASLHRSLIFEPLAARLRSAGVSTPGQSASHGVVMMTCSPRTAHTQV
jgi:hypothetical protein